MGDQQKRKYVRRMVWIMDLPIGTIVKPIGIPPLKIREVREGDGFVRVGDLLWYNPKTKVKLSPVGYYEIVDSKKRFPSDGETVEQFEVSISEVIIHELMNRQRNDLEWLNARLLSLTKASVIDKDRLLSYMKTELYKRIEEFLNEKLSVGNDIRDGIMKIIEDYEFEK